MSTNESVTTSGIQESVSRAGRPKLNRWQAIAGSAFILYLALATFPGTYLAQTGGLDPSWRFAINYAVARGIPFGRSVNFTYGPLGYLITPLTIGSNLTRAVVFWFLVQGLLVGALATHLFVRRRAVPVIVSAIMLLAASAFDLTFEYHLLVVLALMLSLTLVVQRKWGIAVTAMAGGLAGIVLFIKFTLGIASLGMVVVVAVAWLLVDRRSWWQKATAVTGGWLAIVAIVVVTNIGSISSLMTWVRASLAMSNGYGAALSLPSSPVPVSAVIAVAFLCLLIVVSAREREWKPALMGIVMLPALFVAFKHSFIRHPARFFTGLVVASAALLILMATQKRARILLTIGAGIIVLAGARVGCHDDVKAPCSLQGLSAFVGETGISNVGKAVHVGREHQRLVEESVRNLERADRLPASMLAYLRRPGATVDVVPWELSFISANDLEWSPNPVLQLYAATTPWLDRLSAGHFRGPKAPTFVLAQLKDIDGRHPLLDAPLTYRAIVEGYAVVAEDRSEALFLLQKRRRPETLIEHPLQSMMMHAGDWIKVPRSQEDVIANIDMRLTLVGKIRDAFLSIPPVFLDVRYASGKIMPCRVTAALASEGFLIGGLPERLFGSFADFWHGRASGSVVAIRLTGPGLHFFTSTMPVRWFEVPRPLAAS